MAEKQNTQWFYYPGDGGTNNSFYLTMNELGETMVKREIIVHGKPLVVFDISSEFINRIRDQEIDLPSQAKVFWKRGDTVGEWRLHERKIRKRAKVSRWKKMVKTGATR